METSTLPSLIRSQSENTHTSAHTSHRLKHSNSLAPHLSERAVMGSHIASRQYVEQHRAFVEHQRHLHDEERLLWQMEREELHERIQELERMVRSLGGQVESTFQTSQRASSTSTHELDHPSRVSSSTSTGDEFWRGTGGMSGAHPTRAFSEPAGRAPSSSVSTQHLPSIAEGSEGGPRKKSVGFSAGQPSIIGQDFHIHPIPSVSASLRTSNLDGITFKSGVLAANGTNKHPRSRSQSPKQSAADDHADIQMERVPSSEAREPKPQVIDIPASGLTSSALLVKDAGHTPLARVADPEFESSAMGTPKPPPQEAFAENEDNIPDHIPSERSESYFPTENQASQLPSTQYHDVRGDEPTDDPALKGPLALTNEPDTQENSGFLDVLNSKLLEAQKAAEEPESSKDSVALSQDEAASPRLDAEEQEPKLKIKRSMNFGSVFGSSSVGRNV